MLFDRVVARIEPPLSNKEKCEAFLKKIPEDLQFIAEDLESRMVDKPNVEIDYDDMRRIYIRLATMSRVRRGSYRANGEGNTYTMQTLQSAEKMEHPVQDENSSRQRLDKPPRRPGPQNRDRRGDPRATSHNAGGPRSNGQHKDSRHIVTS